MAKLVINDLHVEVEHKEILKGINLTINQGETVALLGPNGHGKSTLLAAIMGHPRYVITKGTVFLDDKNVLEMSVDQRSKAGIFLAMQYPSEVPGVINSDFLKSAVNARREKPLTLFQFYKMLDTATKEMKIPFEMANRSLNEGFSGGEKKRNEILQLKLLQPVFALLDEIDSGLDVDALQTVAEAIKAEQQKGMGFLVVSHYARLYDLISPTKTVVIINGKIILEGGVDIIKRIDSTGYEWIKREYGIEVEKDDTPMNVVSIGTCATKEVTK
jgi:Fe-S cluster assembly ATP-binding protein